MEYLNFDLRIGAKNGEQYPVTVIRSPMGEQSAMVYFPLNDPKFKSQLSRIEKSRGYGVRRNTSNGLDYKEESPRSLGRLSFDGEIKNINALGNDLFENLFATEIRACYRSSLQKAREEKKRFADTSVD